MLKKRSIRLDGHATSIAIEPEFWNSLEKFAKIHNLKLEDLIQHIDATRDPTSSLASSLRVYCLVKSEGEFAKD